MSIKELLDRNPNPSDDEIKDVLGGQICRCTGYQTIFAAVRSAIERLARS
jgi:carbon-monoxide dehydrogenase small subunit